MNYIRYMIYCMAYLINLNKPYILFSNKVIIYIIQDVSIKISYMPNKKS